MDVTVSKRVSPDGDFTTLGLLVSKADRLLLAGFVLAALTYFPIFEGINC